MTTCQKCKYEYEAPQIICPQCGFQTMPSDEMRKDLETYFQKLRVAKFSSLDLSPQGKLNYKLYIDNTFKLMGPLNSLLLDFIEKHTVIMEYPYYGAQQRINLETNLFGDLAMRIYRAMENVDFSTEVFDNPPPGCGNLFIEVGDLWYLNKDLVKTIAKLVGTNDFMSLKKVREIMVNIATSIKKVNYEIEKALDQIK